jgi:hypothetical protein
MLNRLASVLRAGSEPLPPPAAPPATVAPRTLGPTHDHQPIPVYPERSPLVPAVPPAALLDSQADLIARLRQALGLDAARFAALVRPVLERFAARVHLLPASQSDHHCGRGGLLRHGLESAFFAARLSEGRVFGLEVEPEYRKALEPKWRLAVVFAALLHDLGKAIIDVNAVSEDGDLVWNGHGVALWDWLQRHQLPSYYIQWNPGRRDGRHMNFGGVLVRELLGVELIEHLSAGEAREVMDKLILAFTQPSAKSSNLIAALASQAEQESVVFDLEDQAQRAIAAGGSPDRSNGHLMLRSLKRQVDAGEIAMNTAGAPLWLTTDGLFGLVPDIWRIALDPLVREGRIKGQPRESANLTDLMLHHRLILPMPDGRPIWPLTVTVGDVQVDLPTVRFAAVNLVVEEVAVTPAIATIRGSTSTGPVAAVAAGTPTPLTVAAVLPAAASAPVADPRTSRNATPVATPLPAAPGGVASSDPDVDPVKVLLEELAAVPSDGIWLRSIVERFATGARLWGTDGVLYDGRVLLAYPRAFEGLGMEPGALRNQLEDAGWLVKDGASQRMVIDVVVDGASVRGCFANEDFGQRVRDLLRLRPALVPAPGSTPAPPGPSVPDTILGEHLGTNPTAVKPELRHALKRQMYAVLKARRITAKSSPEELAAALRDVMAERGISRRVLNDLMTMTPNPLFISSGPDRAGAVVNPDYKPKDLG